jgi:hypothetical protein
MQTKVRLDKNVVPKVYDIRLKPDLKSFTFEGVEVITLSILKPTRALTLHSREIDVETGSILVGKEKSLCQRHILQCKS